jgi:hypothetical protein
MKAMHIQAPRHSHSHTLVDEQVAEGGFGFK